MDPENSERRGRVPHSHPFMKTSLQPDCIVITTLEKRLEGLGSYTNVLKIQEKKEDAAPSAPPLNQPMLLNEFVGEFG